MAAVGKVPVVYPPAPGHGNSPGIPARQPCDGGGSGGCGNCVDRDSLARLLRVLAQVSLCACMLVCGSQVLVLVAWSAYGAGSVERVWPFDCNLGLLML